MVAIEEELIEIRVVVLRAALDMDKGMVEVMVRVVRNKLDVNTQRTIQ